MTSAPVSVVIPTYNSASLVTRAIDSVLAQTLSPAEILVVDDGSTDDTRQRLQPYASTIRTVHQANQGVSAARNAGVRLASQDYVAFLDADDVWHPRKLELQFATLQQHSELGLLGAQEFDWPAPEYPDVGDARPCLTPVSWADLVVRNRLHTSTLVVRRDVLLRAGTFDVAIQGPEDRDLWLRVAEIAPIANLDLPLTGYRDVPGSVSKHAARCQAGMLRILSKIDQQQKWHGRWLLRRKAYSYVYHSCAFLYAATGAYRAALGCSLLSAVWYPLPYSRHESVMRCERPKRLLVNLLRWVGLKKTAAPRLVQGVTDA